METLSKQHGGKTAAKPMIFKMAFPKEEFVHSTFYDNFAVWTGASSELKAKAMDDMEKTWGAFRKEVHEEQKFAGSI